MTYSVSPGDIFGRIGTGLAQGLSESVPKEIERSRLSAGLRQLENQPDLTPFQQFSRLAGIPGITPQMLQSGSELLRQQGITQALKQKADQEARPKPSPFPERQTPQVGNEAPSLTTRAPLEHTLKNYIPKTFEELQVRAGELLKENPALYGQDPSKALTAAQTEDAQNSAISQAYQGQRAKEQEVQNNVVNSLDSQRQKLGAQLPGNVYSDIEDNAINAVKSKEDGGEGLTEQEAIKKYGKDLDSVSRDYNALEAIGSWSMLAHKPSTNRRNLEALRNNFKERDDLENFADSLVDKNNLTPASAYHFAYPIADNPDLKNAFQKKIGRLGKWQGNTLIVPPSDKEVSEKTKHISEILAPLLGKNGSPLSVAEELKDRNFDPDIWLKYLDKNRKKLNLTERQIRELGKPRSTFPTLSQLWLFSTTDED